MTEQNVRAIPDGMHTITPHIVVRDAARAVEWYKTALGAEERSRIPVPGGKLMSVELRFGDSAVMIADEFPEMGVLSPLSIGGTAVVLHLYRGRRHALAACRGRGRRGVSSAPGCVLGRPSGSACRSFGHRWGIATHVRDVPHDEVVRAAAAFGG